ncbi:MAG: hypothetical protein EOO04_06745 [Chitinophagaceae bacterium]|nr:MAG: hypothetical protein EOO04_06745 [Chitinophagaceae bacterium]
MKSKIILALSLLITVAVTSADAQTAREKKYFKQERAQREFRDGKLSKHDRQKIARSREYRKHEYQKKRHNHYRHGRKNYGRIDKKRHGRSGYGYHQNKLRRFD